MVEIRARNVQQAYARGLSLLRREGVLTDTRNGPAWVHPEPVMMVYERPRERVLIDPVRNANPFFHLMESIWMLAGRRDVKSIGRYIGSLKKYSDDGVIYNGAYGHRWREHFGIDQIVEIVEKLRKNPLDRRIVLQMWDAEQDLLSDSLDIPCNNLCYFRARREPAWGMVLDMTVVCRSNDAIWGAYGANAVHFSVLQEFVAAAAGMRMGMMWQLSNNLHAYVDMANKVGEPSYGSEYACYHIVPTSLFEKNSLVTTQMALDQIEDFWDERLTGPGLLTQEARDVITLMQAAHDMDQAKNRDEAVVLLSDSRKDWLVAGRQWIERRRDK